MKRLKLYFRLNGVRAPRLLGLLPDEQCEAYITVLVAGQQQQTRRLSNLGDVAGARDEFVFEACFDPAQDWPDSRIITWLAHQPARLALVQVMQAGHVTLAAWTGTASHLALLDHAAGAWRENSIWTCLLTPPVRFAKTMMPTSLTGRLSAFLFDDSIMAKAVSSALRHRQQQKLQQQQHDDQQRTPLLDKPDQAEGKDALHGSPAQQLNVNVNKPSISRWLGVYASRGPPDQPASPPVVSQAQSITGDQALDEQAKIDRLTMLISRQLPLKKRPIQLAKPIAMSPAPGDAPASVPSLARVNKQTTGAATVQRVASKPRQQCVPLPLHRMDYRASTAATRAKAHVPVSEPWPDAVSTRSNINTSGNSSCEIGAREGKTAVAAAAYSRPRSSRRALRASASVLSQVLPLPRGTSASAPSSSSISRSSASPAGSAANSRIQRASTHPLISNALQPVTAPSQHPTGVAATAATTKQRRLAMSIGQRADAALAQALQQQLTLRRATASRTASKPSTQGRRVAAARQRQHPPQSRPAAGSSNHPGAPNPGCITGMHLSSLDGTCSCVDLQPVHQSRTGGGDEPYLWRQAQASAVADAASRSEWQSGVDAAMAVLGDDVLRRSRRTVASVKPHGAGDVDDDNGDDGDDADDDEVALRWDRRSGQLGEHPFPRYVDYLHNQRDPRWPGPHVAMRRLRQQL